MVKDHSESEKGNPLLPLHGVPLPISNKFCLARFCSSDCCLPGVFVWILIVWIELVKLKNAKYEKITHIMATTD